jgi:hypothetical protein
MEVISDMQVRHASPEDRSVRACDAQTLRSLSIRIATSVDDYIKEITQISRITSASFHITLNHILSFHSIPISNIVKIAIILDHIIAQCSVNPYLRPSDTLVAVRIIVPSQRTPVWTD